MCLRVKFKDFFGWSAINMPRKFVSGDVPQLGPADVPMNEFIIFVLLANDRIVYVIQVEFCKSWKALFSDTESGLLLAVFTLCY